MVWRTGGGRACRHSASWSSPSFRVGHRSLCARAFLRGGRLPPPTIPPPAQTFSRVVQFGEDAGAAKPRLIGDDPPQAGHPEGSHARTSDLEGERGGRHPPPARPAAG
jgi:hypothetical protein